jgi:hypothetical protein
VSAALAAGAVAAVAVVRDDAEAPVVGGASTPAPAEPAPTDAPTVPTVPAPPSPPTTEVLVTAVAPADVDELMAALAADPGRYGSRAGAVIERLEKLGRGRKASERAADLLADAEAWVASGELDPAVLAMLGPVLTPIADGPGNGRR